jgi:large subunit ribosomal protein L25
MPIQLKLEKRVRLGSREARRLRREGMLPGVIYGHGDEQPVKMNAHEFMTTVGYAKSLGIVELHLDDQKLKGIIKDVQWNSLSDKPVHIDLQQVSDNQILTVPVPVHLEGLPKGVSVDGGILDHSLHEVNLTVKASDIPPEITVDISEMRMNDRLHLSDLKLPEGIQIDLTTDLVIASVIAPKALKVKGSAEDTEEDAAGEESASQES